MEDWQKQVLDKYYIVETREEPQKCLAPEDWPTEIPSKLVRDFIGTLPSTQE